MKMDPVVHFEMPAKNKKRVAKFYSSAFGWQMQQFGPEMGNYILAGTTPVGKNQRPKNPGAINGGFYEWSKEYKEPSVVIAVEDLKKSISKVKKAGGKVLIKPMDISGIGLYVSFKDSEGNRVVILQPSQI